VLLTPDDGLALVDLGMVAHVPPKLRDRLLKLMLAAVDGRGEDAAEVCMGLGTKLDDWNEAKFTRETAQLIAQYHAYERATRLSEGRLVLDLARMGAACGLRPAAEMTLLGKTLLNLEAVSKALDPNMNVKRVVEKLVPVTEVLLVLDATTGQNGLRQARVFGEVVNVTGIVLTKLDGTAKGGIALAIAQELGLPVKLIGIGEQIEDLRPFDADDFARAILE